MRYRWFWLIPLLALAPVVAADPPGDKAAGGDKPAAKKPATPDAEYEALMQEIKDAQTQAQKDLGKATDDEAKQKVVKDFRAKLAGYGGRFLTFAEKNPKNKHAFEALSLVIQVSPHGPKVQRAIELMASQHADNKEALEFAQQLAEADIPGADKLVRAVLAKNTDPKTQATLSMSLAKALANSAQQPGVSPAEAGKLNQEAEGLLEKLAANNKADFKELADQGKDQLYVLRHLSVGKEAPNVQGKDADDKKFALKDYRGKVVLLDFWASW
jgi:hypothetical protein